MNKEKSKKELDALLKCIKNINTFLKFIQITTPAGKTSFNPYQYQIRLLKKLAETYDSPDKHNNIIVKSRQVGMTTLLAIYILWFALFKPDKYIGIISCTTNNAKILYDMVRGIYDSLPDFLRIKTIQNNSKYIKFANGSTICISACKSNSVKGRTIDLLVFDEAAYTKKSDFNDFIMSIFPTLAGRKSSQIIIASTPNGIDNIFYELWKKTIENKNSFIPTKIDWRCVPHHDQIWYNKMVTDYGQAFATQELDAQFVGSTKF